MTSDEPLAPDGRTNVSDVGSDEFICAACHGTFTKGWSDEEAQAEADTAGFVDQSVTVCEDCYVAMMATAEREGWDPSA